MGPPCPEPSASEESASLANRNCFNNPSCEWSRVALARSMKLRMRIAKIEKKRTTEQKITLRKFRCLLKSLFENKVLVKCIYKCLCRERVKEAERK